jgi:hypothetical protein
LSFNNDRGRLSICCNKNKRILAISGDFESDIDKNTIKMKTSISRLPIRAEKFQKIKLVYLKKKELITFM